MNNLSQKDVYEDSLKVTLTLSKEGRSVPEIAYERELSVLVGKHLLSEYPEDAMELLEKTLLGVVEEAYKGYLGDATEILEIINEADDGRAEQTYNRIARDYPTRTKLKHDLKKVLLNSKK